MNDLSTPKPSTATDPVCGMSVNPAAGKPRHEHNGQTYWFCCDGCRKKFAADPGAYLKTQATPGGCCGSAAKTPAAPATATDPVCGMSVDTAAGKPHHQHDGQTYWFCCDGCRKKFAADPAAYLHAQKKSAGCCGSQPATSDAETATDPVCGMQVEVATSTRHSAWQGQTYHFCSDHCLHKFSADPQHWITRDPHQVDASNVPEGTMWICPMDPEVRQDHPGACPKCGMALEPESPTAGPEDDSELRDMRRRFVIGLAFSIPLLWLSMGTMLPGAASPLHWLAPRVDAWLQLLLALPVVLWAGAPFWQRGWASLVYRSLNMFTLIGLGVASAFAFSIVALLAPHWLPATDGMPDLYFEAAAVITTLALLGQVLELRARAQTSGAIRALLALAPPQAHRLDGNDHESDVPLESVAVGDRLRVRPGEKMPVDGTVLDGDTHVDESMLTGESSPQRRRRGDTVTAGSVNGSGTLLIEAKHVGNDTLLAQIVKQVAQAQRSRAPVQRLADRVAAIFVPAVITIAVLAGLGWAWFGPAPVAAHALVAAVSVLIVACPCALGLATPMSIMVGVGRGAQLGVLIRDAAALETLQTIDTLVVDKTGTLTEGKPSLRKVAALDGVDEQRVLQLAASVESASEHPLARAIVNAAKARDLALPTAQNFGSDPGLGVWAQADGAEVLVGNVALLQQRGVDAAALSSAASTLREHGDTAVLVAIDGQPAGVLAIADAIKAGTLDALRDLHAAGVRVLMVTGDHTVTAQAVAKELGIDEVVAEVLPADKAAVVTRLQREGRRVAMAGDGVNDAPALATANVGIAMGTGTDVAMESAGVTLLSGDLRGIATALRLSRATMRNIRQNLLFAFGYNALGVPIAAGLLYPLTGWLLSPMLASAAMSLSSVSVIGNALRLRGWHLKAPKTP
ncbi:heavy metal translocating P-type ATPase [Solimonas marina]|uniref:Heavy metal translocating P-type ATPase n=1 Tax=Solimonas marina TaxID=2714601 RepID=A0A970B627_9GAMM|nr:heavy metal translocating P-type ATPase [Solimonas marina]NKF22358.1 heavy metal translocating P-type ATPase [Solimonas marina]